MTICELCTTNEAVFLVHFEEHVNPPREIDTCRSCHVGLHSKLANHKHGPIGIVCPSCKKSRRHLIAYHCSGIFITQCEKCWERKNKQRSPT